ncbi:MAG: S49 family peptidase [Chromatiales bacterium]
MTEPPNTPDQTREPSARPGSGNEDWQRRVIDTFAYEVLREQRRARRWGIFFKLLGFSYLVALLILYRPAGLGGGIMAGARHTALIEVRGIIADDAEASADNIVTALRGAFENKRAAAIILRINSPGGSPVQAGYVSDEIVRLREEYPDKKVYAVITDICASGGYYIAAAADAIYADKASIVGSIGVLMDGFGFVGSMEKLGVERRLLTAGENKSFLDPFSPVRTTDVEHAREMLKEVHQQFVNTVKRGRRDRLKEDGKLYSGLVWTGVQAVEMGLVDALGSAGYVAREVVKAKDIVDYTPRQPYLDKVARRLGAALAQSLVGLSLR